MKIEDVNREDVNRAFKAASSQAEVVFDARNAARDAARKLAEMERDEIAKASEYGAPPDKLQRIVAEKTATARAEAEEATTLADYEGHRLQLLHYELDRIKTIIELMRCKDGDA